MRSNFFRLPDFRTSSRGLLLFFVVSFLACRKPQALQFINLQNFDVETISAGESVKQSFEAFARGDIDAMTANFADTLLYSWSSGDSLRGKKAVADYYKGRRSLIDSVSVAEPIVLPIQVNESQSKYAPTGKWVLYWAMLNVKYKNGKKISFWMHNVNHFNEAGKVDYIGQYIDRGQIAAATAGMK